MFGARMLDPRSCKLRRVSDLVDGAMRTTSQNMESRFFLRLRVFHEDVMYPPSTLCTTLEDAETSYPLANQLARALPERFQSPHKFCQNCVFMVELMVGTDTCLSEFHGELQGNYEVKFRAEIEGGVNIEREFL